MKLWLIVGLALALPACLARTPGVNGKQYAQPTFAHASFIGTNPCESCHETNRPAPIEGAVHGGGNDCIMCHTPKDDNSGWLPVNSFTHVPKPTTCLECHAANRPAKPHMQDMDCVLCHVFNAATPTVFQILPGATDTAPPAATTTTPAAALQGGEGG